MRDAIASQYPDESKNTISNYLGQLYKFVMSMKNGDKVILPSKIAPGRYYVGIISGDCICKLENAPYTHTRKVKWQKESLNKTDLDEDIVHSLGAYLTIFSLTDEQEQRIFKRKTTKVQPKQSDDDDEDEPDTNIEEESRDQITNRILHKFKGAGMQDVVASILKAKGFSTYVSRGADKGIDVLASNGELGFGGTKICVQVKTENTPIEHSVLRDLEGTMRNVGADYGLLVSWSGFRSSIDSEVRDKFFTIKFWDHKKIVDEFLANYDNLDEEIKMKVPLKRIWVIDDQSEL